MAGDGARVGVRAPDFALPSTLRGRVSLGDYQDRWLTLIFYPRDFSLVCPTELTALSARFEEFQRRECDLIGVSTDSVETHERWLAPPRSQGGLGGLRYPLASDEDGAVCRAYGVYVPRQHLALRGLFIIDPNGVLQYQVVHNLSVGRSSEEILRVLDALQTGGLCPENWTRETPTLDAASTLGPNSSLGQYRIDGVLGSGTFGTVFRATDMLLQRSVALKVLGSRNDESLTSLLDEARAAAALNHPNVCIIYGVDASDGVPMIVMEYIDGQSLGKLLESGPVPEELAASLARQVAQGMTAAHAHGIVHGDLKPANIMVAADGVAKIMDFGLARRIARGPASADPARGISGTPRYMAPEQTRNEPVMSASDVFSFGLILYEALTGKAAVNGGNLLEVLRAIDRLEAEQLARQTPEPFASILRQALVREPERRVLTMARIAELLS